MRHFNSSKVKGQRSDIGNDLISFIDFYFYNINQKYITYLCNRIDYLKRLNTSNSDISLFMTKIIPTKVKKIPMI